MGSRADVPRQAPERDAPPVPSGLMALGWINFVVGASGSIAFLATSSRITSGNGGVMAVILLFLGGISSILLIVSGSGYLEAKPVKGFWVGIVQAGFSYARGFMALGAIDRLSIQPIDLVDVVLPTVNLFFLAFVFRRSFFREPRGRASEKGGVFRRLALDLLARKARGAGTVLIVYASTLAIFVITQGIAPAWVEARRQGASTAIEASIAYDELVGTLSGAVGADPGPIRMRLRHLLYETPAPLSVISLVYRFLLPFLAAALAAGSLFDSRGGTQARQIVVRTSRETFFWANYAVMMAINAAAAAIAAISASFVTLFGFGLYRPGEVAAAGFAYAIRLVLLSAAWTSAACLIGALSRTRVEATLKAAGIAVMVEIAGSFLAGTWGPTHAVAWLLPFNISDGLFAADFPSRFAAGVMMIVYSGFLAFAGRRAFGGKRL